MHPPLLLCVQKVTPETSPVSPIDPEEEDLPPLTWGPRPLKRKRQPLSDFKRRVRTVGANDTSRCVSCVPWLFPFKQQRCTALPFNEDMTQKVSQNFNQSGLNGIRLLSRGRLVSQVEDDQARLSECQVLNDGYLRVTVERNGQVFTGVLMPSLERPARYPTWSTCLFYLD